MTRTLLQLNERAPHEHGLPRVQPSRAYGLQRAAVALRDITNPGRGSWVLRRIQPTAHRAQRHLAESFAPATDLSTVSSNAMPAPILNREILGQRTSAPALILRQREQSAEARAESATVNSPNTQPETAQPRRRQAAPTQSPVGRARVVQAARPVIQELDTVKLPAPSLAAPLAPGNLARQSVQQVTAQRSARGLEPVSAAWRRALLREDTLPPESRKRRRNASTLASMALPEAHQRMGEEATPVPNLPPPSLNQTPLWQVDEPATVPAVMRAIAHFAPLELALDRLLGHDSQPTETLSSTAQPMAWARAESSPTPRSPSLRSPRQQVAPPAREAILQRMEASGWRFKRSTERASALMPEMAQSVDDLAQPVRGRPIPKTARTLMERVLQRDFAGVRVQMAALGALGIEAAADGNTVYLSPAAARLDSPDALALLGHELTHVAAAGYAPPIQRTAEDQPLPLADQAFLTRTLSRQLVNLSLGAEETMAQRVESWLGRQAERRVPRAGKAEMATRTQATANLAQRTVDGRQFTPASALWRGNGTPLLPPESALPQNSEKVLAEMEEAGWRFKRADRVAASPVNRVQRAAGQLAARPAGGMPLPMRPRTLLESVLQRDFSGVRMQVAGLEPMGVEAAAQGETIYLQRETATRLEQPKNLALLSHELTHVIASGHAPVQRSPQLEAGNDGLPLFALAPTSIVRSPAAEEQVAERVERSVGQWAVQRAPQRPLAARSTPPIETPTTTHPPPTSIQGMPLVQRAGRSDVETVSPTQPVLAGLSAAAMPVAQRFHIPVTRQAPPTAESPVAPPAGVHLPSSPLTVQRSQTTEQSTESDETEGRESAERGEPDWNTLADKVYPLIKRMLSLERDRLSR